MEFPPSYCCFKFRHSFEKQDHLHQSRKSLKSSHSSAIARLVVWESQQRQLKQQTILVSALNFWEMDCWGRSTTPILSTQHFFIQCATHTLFWRNLRSNPGPSHLLATCRLSLSHFVARFLKYLSRPWILSLDLLLSNWMVVFSIFAFPAVKSEGSPKWLNLYP